MDVTVWTLVMVEDFSSRQFRGPPKLQESGASELKNSEIDVGCTRPKLTSKKSDLFI